MNDRRGPSTRTRRGTPLSELPADLTENSRKVIGCAIEVHKELGPGYPLAIYRKALALMMDDEEITYEFDKAYTVEFDGDPVGEVVADIFAGNRFVVRLMAEHAEIGTQPRSELRAVLRAADLELGLIINFGERRLKDGLVRVLNPDKLNARAEGEDYESDAPHDAPHDSPDNDQGDDDSHDDDSED
ncbi:MAG: GxxExxY protein [Phycisphaerales bacterium]|jgi:GxxExxY protein